MNRNELKTIASRWMSLWSVPVDWEVFDDIHSDDFIDFSPAGRGPAKSDFGVGLSGLVGAFPDLSTKIEEWVVDEELQRVAIRWRSTGTNRSEYLGTGPTNRKIHIYGIEIIEIKEGQVSKRWGEWDISEHQ